MPRVREIMEKNVASVAPSASIMEVAQRMREGGIGAVIVCENGKLRGVVTEERIISGIVASARNPKHEDAASLMCNDIPQVPPGADIVDAAKMMASHGVRLVPVVQNRKYLGMLTVEDLFKESPTLAVMVMTHSIHKG